MTDVTAVEMTKTAALGGDVEANANAGGNDGNVFTFRDVSFTVVDKKTKQSKDIISGVSAAVHSGRVLAIMGVRLIQ